MSLRLCAMILIASLAGTRTVSAQPKEGVTYEKDVSPIVGKYCLPCHLEDNENPSGLALDSYSTLMKGGEHEEILVPGKPDESLLYKKLQNDPPFGKKMPRNRKTMTDAEIRTIYDWIKQGAKEK